ncbi:Phosphoglycerate/bisphosphoglycerate mutase [Beggiatoa sp. PS]|nr:Phosphoglycerate/bisphosphoglycerate mutase [Beggiatoa sp. PS]
MTHQKTQIVLIRHGETLWNLEGRIQGHLDSPLTDVGLAQTEALAKHFKFQKFAALYSSDLGRAYETARKISEQNGLPIIKERQLRERNFGLLQGVIKDTLANKFPEAYRHYRARDPAYVVPKGESFKQFHARCIKCFNELAQKHNKQRILVVAHGGVLVSLFKHTLNIPLEAPRRFLSLNTSINIFSYQEGNWMLEVWGDLSHLHQTRSLDDSVE